MVLECGAFRSEGKVPRKWERNSARMVWVMLDGFEVR